MRKAVFTRMSRARLATLEPEPRDYATDLIASLAREPVGRSELRSRVPRFQVALVSVSSASRRQLRPDQGVVERARVVHGRPPPPDDQVRVAQNVIAFWNYVEQFVHEHDRDRGDDLTSELLHYHVARPTR
jgi:cytochrome P450